MAYFLTYNLALISKVSNFFKEVKSVSPLYVINVYKKFS